MTRVPLQPHRLLSIAAGTATAALTLVACEADSGGVPETTTGITTTMTSSAAAPTTTEVVTETGAPSDDTVQQSLGTTATTDTSTQTPAGDWDLHITDVRAGEHNGFDRVVIEFSGTGSPGWFAAYTQEPRQQGSGFPIDYSGDTALELMVSGVALPDGSAGDYPVGPTGTAHGAITDVSHNGIFEGQAQFVVGLRGEPRPYTVTALNNPPRLVVDIGN